MSQSTEGGSRYSTASDRRPGKPLDLGFGQKVADITSRRLINRDGSFNSKRVGYPLVRSRSLFHWAINCSWLSFLSGVVAVYIVINLFLGIIYFLCGPSALAGLSNTSTAGHLLECFFFSIHTFSTIGYGHLSPQGLLTNSIVVIEVFIGLLGFAVATGFLFARCSRPSARLMYSDRAVIAPYHEGTAFMFRVANERRTQLINVDAHLTMSRLEQRGDGVVRNFYRLPLERDEVRFFTLYWTVVHPIDESSPLFGMTYEQLIAADTEFLVLLGGIDDTFSQGVHSWISYKADEVVWGARFRSILDERDDGTIRVDLRQLHDIEAVEVPLPDANTVQKSNLQ